MTFVGSRLIFYTIVFIFYFYVDAPKVTLVFFFWNWVRLWTAEKATVTLVDGTLGSLAASHEKIVI